MPTSYADIQLKILQMLQDPTGATYDKTTEVAYWIEESLKELATYDPHIVRVPFKIESRSGTATSGTTTKTLEDTTNDQFLATDDDNEKVVYNTTDETWAVITSYSTAETVGLSANIMAEGENYKIYNKHCYNNKQIYIGDVGDYLKVDKVEYKCSKWPRSWRNWKIYGDVLEIDIDFTPTDTDEVNVYYARPHKLCQLTTLIGACTNIEPVDETTLAVKGLTGTEIIEIGDELYIAGHRSLYTVTTGVTLVAGAGNIIVSPGMEFATAVDDVITFTKSTLKPQHEEIFCHLVAARAVLSDNIRHINAIPKGGANVWSDYQSWAERKLGEVLGKLERLSPPKTKRLYNRD